VDQDGRSQEKHRYVTLDAMRGIAAIAVVMEHFGGYYHTWRPPFSFLAVDLFFVLSGFVISLNYDRRFSDGMTVAAFMRLRAIRLLPLLFVGAAAAVITRVVAHNVFHLSSIQILVTSLLTTIAIPTPPTSSTDILFPLNTAFWSLFFEIWVANLIFALFWKRLHGTCLWAVIIASLVGLLAMEGHFHVMDTGWAWRNIAGGFPRVGFSFFLGVALARWHVGRKIRLKVSAPLCLIVLTAALILPTSGQMFRLLSFAEVAFLFPALVYFGAEAVEVNPRVGSLLGDASYAVYAIHIPLLVFVDWACNGLATGWSVGGALPILEAIFVLMVVIVALFLDARYDRPMRRFLLEFSTRFDSNHDRLYGHTQSSRTGQPIH